ncbi:hypothetical protein PQE70_gp001 [Bacillus phage vB_BanS_Nate]|uniref:Uncharacterized protein n=1 Tax=Bacillus phage vB_BanS_Nate TaxID=2894788 RepID=A0AAE8YXI7_9CAUD|nr:hypothetical protein PQE70_gp001 [Bacillus phage vB_BanS_Nate]UGO50854.1 hypothetical protein NATE_1 [Bacillus phage vB_BanS_Nate]
MNIVKTLKNGVKVVENVVEDCLQTCQEILDVNPITSNFDAYCAYNERPENDFEHTYIVKIEREADYDRFLAKFSNEVKCGEREYDEQYRAVQQQYYDDIVTHQEYKEKAEELRANKRICECSKCQFTAPTITEWKTGRYSERGIKLNKAMRKAGFSQELLDFYSAQIKTEKEVCLTVTSASQYIAGMSYYCELETWDGFNGSSCQDPRHDDEEYCINLGGALHDNKLFIGMLHAELDDLEDFTDKMLARTLFRYIEIDGKPLLVALQYYGNNTTKSELGIALNQLNEVDIYSTDISNKYSHYSEIELHKEKANGTYEYEICDEVNVCTEIDEYIDIDCPMCEGSGDYEVYSHKIEKHMKIDCPMCGGDGTYETHVYHDIDEWVEVEDTKEIKPYVEGYTHNDYNIEIQINMKRLKEIREGFKNEVTA